MSSAQVIQPPFPEQNLHPPGVENKMNPRPLFKAEKYLGSEKLIYRRALITGGDSGIGRSICVLFAREGADVIFTHLAEEKEDAEFTEELIRREGRNSLAIEIDLTSKYSEEYVRSLVLEQYDSIDILVNNAAFQNHVDGLENLSLDQFYHTFDTNVFAHFRLIKCLLPHINDHGAIINTDSILGYTGNNKLIDYSCTKAALHSLTKSLAKELAPRNIRVNAVAPGPVWTPLNPAERRYEDLKDFGENTSFDRPAQPEEIAPAYVFLASNVTGSYITGETINIFGKVTGAN